MRGTIQPLLGGAFVVHDYVWSVDGEPQEGRVLLGFDLRRGAFVGAWIDSWHNGTALMELAGGDAAGPISVVGSYPATPPGPPWGWRIVHEPEPPARLRIEHFNITPGGEEALAVQVDYARVT